MDSLRIKLSFFISCVFHFVFLVGVGLVPHHKPIVVTFPVELITLPAEKIETNTEVISPKKEEIIIPKKPQKKVFSHREKFLDRYLYYCQKLIVANFLHHSPHNKSLCCQNYHW